MKTPSDFLLSSMTFTSLMLASSIFTFGSLNVYASSLDAIDQLDQEQFLTLAEQLGAATQYKSIAPVENQGTLGFDVGLEVSATEVDDSLFDVASNGSVDEEQLVFARVHVHKGLPFGLDLGASLGNAPGVDMTVAGGELRYAFVKGGAVTPAVGIRATYSLLLQPDEFTLTNTGLELAISKGVLFFTPYAGIGIVRTSIKPEGDTSGLQSETFDQNKLVVGATVNLGLAWTFEADRTEDISTYSAKVGLRF